LIGYSFKARLLVRHFWTLSVWVDDASLQAFVNAPPHRDMMQALVPHMGPTRFVRWTVRGVDVPVGWEEALDR